MKTITKLGETISCEVAPTISVSIKILIVETELIPALSQIMGTHSEARDSTPGIYLPVRVLFITENPDGTFAVLNDLRTIAPEATRSTSRYVVAALAKFDLDETTDEEAAIRTLLAIVEPARQARTNLQYITDAQRGTLEKLAKIYTGGRVDPRKRVAASAMLPAGQLAPSTFQRICKALKTPRKKEKPAKKDDEVAPEEIPETEATVSDEPEKREQKEQNKVPEPEDTSTADSQADEEERQRELF